MSKECKVPEAHLRRMLEAGGTYESIARETGWSSAAIRKRCVGLGLPRPAPYNKVIDDSRLVELLIETDLTLPQISLELGVTHAGAWKRAARVGIPTDAEGRNRLRSERGLPPLPMLRRGGRRRFSEDDVVAALAATGSPSAAAERLGCSPSLVCQRTRGTRIEQRAA